MEVTEVSDRLTAEHTVNKFVKCHGQEMLDFAHVPLEATDLMKSFRKHELNLTHFNDLYDTLLYSRLIQKALEFTNAQLLIDLCAGSSVPSLLAVKETGREDVRIVAVDLDPEAREVGQNNARTLGLNNRYTFLNGQMDKILQTNLFSGPLLVVSNPPFIPVPRNVRDQYLIPIHGGDDGSVYMELLLNQPYPVGTTLALLWGSLTNPLKVLPMLERKFEVLHLETMRIHFGDYTSLPVVRSHLYRLREEGRAVFEGESGMEKQLVFGAVLRPRHEVASWHKSQSFP